MGEVAVREHSALAMSRNDDPAGDLIAWAQAAQQAHLIAVQLAETSFVPKNMQHMPGEVTGAILAGRELGLSPMASLRSIDIIDGTPAMRALALRGLVEFHGHEVWVEESTEHRAIVCGRRRRAFNPFGGAKDHPGHVERSVWTLDRARKAELLGKKNWQRHPTAMLVARATAEVCRLIAADILIGMPYASEELSDGGDPGPSAGTTEPTTEPTAPARRRLKRAATPPPDPAGTEPALTPEPAVEGDAAAPAPPVPDQGPIPGPEPGGDDDDGGAGITRAQSSRMHATFNGLGIRDRTVRMSVTSQIVGRDVPSSADLTRREAGMVIDALEQGWPPGKPDDPEDDPEAGYDESIEVLDPEDLGFGAGLPSRPIRDADTGGYL